MTKTMTLWTMPRDYMGAEWYDYYVCLGRHRDSGLLDNSNFETAYKMLSAVNMDNWQGEESPLQIVRSSHWAVGWVEWIAIHKDCQALVDMGNAIVDKLDDYPILNEEHYSECEMNATYENVCQVVRYAGYSEKRAHDVHEWLDNNESRETENRDDQGGYPSEESVIRACKALGMRRVK